MGIYIDSEFAKSEHKICKRVSMERIAWCEHKECKQLVYVAFTFRQEVISGLKTCLLVHLGMHVCTTMHVCMLNTCVLGSTEQFVTYNM